MLALSFARVVKFAFQDMLRNISLSLMTVFILVLMLLSINTLIVIQVLTNEATRSVKEQIDVSLFFSSEATDEEVTEVREYIELFPEVVGITYQSREEVLEEFKAQHADSEDIVTSLDELQDNPLGPTMIVQMREPSDYQKVIEALQVPEYENIIEHKNFNDTQKTIERIDTVTSQVERFSLALSVLFAVIAFLIIFNTIRVAIYTHRVEISIKKLVGATNWFIRGPYLLESFIFSLLSVAIALGIVLTVLHGLDPYIGLIFSSEGILTNYFNSHILMLLGLQFLSVFILTVISSLLAMRRHLRV